MDNNYINAFKSTILEIYPLYLKKIILSQFIYEGYIIDTKRKGEQLALNITDSLDVTEHDTPDEKIKAILTYGEDLLCYFEDFEYKKEFRHICYFECKTINSNIIEALVKANEINVYDKKEKKQVYDDFNKPTIHIAGNLIYLKFARALNNDHSQIKYTTLCVIDIDSEIIELRLDRVGIEYKRSYDFYKGEINRILQYLRGKLQLEITDIEFKAIVEYMKSEKDDITIYAQKMNRNGTTAYLETYDDEEAVMPILGELEKYIEDNKSLFDIDDNTLAIKAGLEKFIQEIEIKSDLPMVKFKIDSQNIKIGITHNYKDASYSLFMLYGDLIGSTRRMDYVREFLSNSYKQLKNEIQPVTIPAEEN